jgi:WD40 repeat protein
MTPDGKFMVTGEDREVRVWELSTGKPVGQAVPWHKTTVGYIVGAVAISPGGKTVATGGEGGIPRLYDVATGELKAIQPQLGAAPHAPGAIHAIAFSPDGTMIVTGHAVHDTAGRSSSARLWDVATGQQISLPLAHSIIFAVVDVAFSADGRMLVTAGGLDKSARLWDMPRRPPAAIELPPIGDLAFSPDGKLIGTGGVDKDKKGVAPILDRATGKQLGDDIVPGQGTIRVVTFSPDGKTFATASNFLDENRKGWVVHRWDVGTRKPVGRPLECDVVPVTENSWTSWWQVTSIAISADGKTLTTTESMLKNDGRVRQWNLDTGEFIAELHPGVSYDYWLSKEVASPDGKRKLKLGESDYTVTVTGPSPSESGQIQHQGWLQCAAFSQDGVRFLTGSADQTARLWDSATLKAIGPRIKHPKSVLHVGCSPDGTEFWTGSPDGARLQCMPPSVSGSAERITLWVQVLTGAELNGVQYVLLSGDEWLKRIERLEELGGPPLP